MKIKTSDIIVVVGQRGSGKTTWIKHLLPLYRKAQVDVTVFDPIGEYKDVRRVIPKTNSPAELGTVMRSLWRGQDHLLVVSEAEMYLPNVVSLPPDIFQYVTRGRHRNLGLIADSRRIANLSKTVFGLAEYVVIFRLFSPNDIGYIKKFLDIKSEDIRGLADYEHWIYHRGHGTRHGAIDMAGLKR